MKQKGLENTMTIGIVLIVLITMIGFALFILAQQQVSGREIRNPLASAQDRQFAYAFEIADEANARNALSSFHVVLNGRFNDEKLMKEKLKEFMYCRATASECATDQAAFRNQFNQRIRSVTGERSYRMTVSYLNTELVFESDQQQYDEGPANYYYLFPMPSEAAEIHFVVEGPTDSVTWRK